MERRCRLLENCPQLQYLEEGVHKYKDSKGEILPGFNPRNMRSTLFDLMKEEVQDFCENLVLQATDKHQQVIIVMFNSTCKTKVSI